MYRNQGFTLIEVMIVVVIVAILASVALPSFREQLRKSRRAEAVQCLSDMQLRQERWRTNNATYADSTGIPNVVTTFYTCSVTANSATGFTLSAAPTAGGSQAGDRCGTFTVTNNAGAITKGASATDCWGN